MNTDKYRPEYGKICQSCYRRTESRIYYRPTIGMRGKRSHLTLWRRLCINCWKMAEEKKI
jgi:hypothetical protein